MQKRELEIINKLGLHARAAAKLVNLASKFQSHISVSRNGQEVNGKSIMGIMMLAASRGTRIEVTATGEDEAEAVDAIEALINDRFQEGE